MPHLPAWNQFARLAEEFDLVPVYRRLVSDTLTPVSAFRCLDDGGPACLFESVIGGEKVGRYSIVSCQPFRQLRARGEEVRLIDQQGLEQVSTSSDPLEDLRRQLLSFRAAPAPELPPFLGGAVGYAGYDTVRYCERLPHPPCDDRGLDDLCFAFYDRLLVFDNVTKTLYAIALARLDQHPSAAAARSDAESRIDQWVEKLSLVPNDLPLADIDPSSEAKVPYHSNFTSQAFQDAVRKCVHYIQAGDIFQVVISQRLETSIHADPFEIYRSLRVINPSPFMFFLRTPQVTLVGSSPEILCRVADRRVTVRPLAGTRRRGLTETEDRRLAEELLADPKERAEHVMLVDLGRNDVGRVARFGSVELSDVMVIERYSHVMHITSNVEGELAADKDAFDALRACLPAGTVSGAPKVRAMEIIDELEPHRRGPYAGAVGYLDYRGNMDTCIALRTLVVQGDKAYVQAGAGIVADSQPQMEYDETLNKAQGLLTAIEVTHQRCSQA